MAVTIENSASDASTGQAVTLTITSADLLMVGIGYLQGGIVPTAVTWDAAGVNESLTQLKRQRESVNTGIAVDIWYLKNPTAGSSKSITATMGGAGTIGIAAYGLLGADVAGTTFGDDTLTGGTADTEGGAADPATVTVTTAAGNLVIDMLMTQNLSSFGANQTAVLDDFGTGAQFGSSWQDGADGGVMSWTKDGGGTQHWSIAAVSINASGGGGSTPSPAAGTLSLTGTTGSLGFTINMPDEA
jgi:hypothetical protein